MKNCRPLFSLLMILFFIISVSQAQNTLKNKPIAIDAVTKPVDLSFDHSYFIIISEEFSSDQFQTQFSKDYILNYLTYDPVRDPKRLACNTGLIFGASLIEFAILWSLPESETNWNKEEILEKQRIGETGLAGIWRENIEAGPVWDHDSFFFNWISHPWVGGVYYMSARGSGYKIWESFSYSLIMSTLFWEFGVEAVVEIPSWQNIIITPVIGSLIGEQFFRLKKKIIKNEKKSIEF